MLVPRYRDSFSAYCFNGFSPEIQHSRWLHKASKTQCSAVARQRQSAQLTARFRQKAAWSFLFSTHTQQIYPATAPIFFLPCLLPLRTTPPSFPCAWFWPSPSSLRAKLKQPHEAKAGNMIRLSRHALTFLRAQYLALVKKAWSLGLRCLRSKTS